MQSPQVKVNNLPIVFGGNVDSTLRTWMSEIGVNDFAHAKFAVISIDPLDIKLSADYIKNNYAQYEYVFTVGIFADRTLKLAGIDHGAWPSTRTKNKKEIEQAFQNCRNYLMRRMYHAPSTNPILSS